MHLVPLVVSIKREPGFT